jgi:hypothetical protein
MGNATLEIFDEAQAETVDQSKRGGASAGRFGLPFKCLRRIQNE